MKHLLAVEFDSQGEPFDDACSHDWIDPDDPPIERAPYSPVIGPGRYEMQHGTTYHCRKCGAHLTP